MESSFADFVPPDNMVNFEFVMGIKLGDFGMVIEHQVYEFTHTYLGDHFVAQSHIYPVFMDTLLKTF